MGHSGFKGTHRAMDRLKWSFKPPCLYTNLDCGKSRSRKKLADLLYKLGLKCGNT